MERDPAPNLSPQDREAALFETALEKSGREREALLRGIEVEEPALYRRVKALLAAAQQAGDLLTPLPEPACHCRNSEAPEVSPDEAVGQTIGRYKLLENVGEGGCGVVYVAEQIEPVCRRVALKVIKVGMDTKAVVARFEAERQALAMMDHLNIAKVLDAGRTETGRPYFVMELVRGIKITDYCDENRLTTEERLKLFIQVCQAIQHAHQKGIIHRDIKPSNILVTRQDGVPVPKVIDFGVAKATTGRLTNATVYTQLHQLIGTPTYMSPEQAEMTSVDVDTRSDIYSLGVLLYELLTGRTPFDAGELVSAGLDAMRQKIRETEPVRPSTRLATLKPEELTTTAKRRSVEAPRLISLLKGDLDWVIMKCLEKDRGRRYDTANGLATDLERYLANEPVVARPPSTLYRLRKSVRRNKFTFAAGATVAAALSLGMIISLWEAKRAGRAEVLALQSRSNAEKLANFMLEDFYAELEPSGEFETVARLARQAVAYYDSLPPSLRTLDTDRNRAMAQARLALVTARQGDFKGAMPVAQEAAATLEQMRRQGDQSDGTMFSLGLALRAQHWCYNLQFHSRSFGAPLDQAARALRPLAISADGSRRIKLEYANLLNHLSHAQPPEQGIGTCEEALRILTSMGALDLSDLAAASAWSDIADSEAREAFAVGRDETAERLEKQAQALAEGVLARRPGDLRARQDLYFAWDVLGLVEARRFHGTAALQLFTQTRQACEDYIRFNPSDVDAARTLAGTDHGLAALLFRDGRVGEALQKLRTSIQVDSDSHATGNIYRNLLLLASASWEAQRGNRDAADKALDEARHFLDAIASKDRMPDRLKERWMELANHAERQVRLAFGEDATVLTLARDALPRLEKLSASENDPEVASVLLFHKRQALHVGTRAALGLGLFAEAEVTAHALLSLPLATGVFAERVSLDQPDDVAWARVLLAQATVEQGRQAEALKTLEPALAHYREAQLQGAAHVTFRHHFARALYVQALAETSDYGGIARRRDLLDQAARLLNALSDEARLLHDSKELLSWIAVARKKLNQDAPQP